MKIKYAMTIAGSDPSGGAGIQADIKTFTSLGVYCAAVITSLTVQNTVKVFDSIHLDPEFIKYQIKKVLEDLPIMNIKTGMLGNSEIIKGISNVLNNLNIVCDPVIISKSGYNLISDDSIDTLKEYIISKSLILTPNYYELIKLNYNKVDEPIKMGENILNEFKNLNAILIKGGHINENENKINDILIIRKNNKFKYKIFSHSRINTKNTHGTGCTLSSAITAYLAKGLDIENAVKKSIKYIKKLIKYSSKYKIGNGNGPLLHYKHIKGL